MLLIRIQAPALVSAEVLVDDWSNQATVEAVLRLGKTGRSSKSVKISAIHTTFKVILGETRLIMKRQTGQMDLDALDAALVSVFSSDRMVFDFHSTLPPAYPEFATQLPKVASCIEECRLRETRSNGGGI